MSVSPGTVRCTSQNRSSPSHGKCGLATSMPPPEADRSAPMAHPLEPMSPGAASATDSAKAPRSTAPSDPGPDLAEVVAVVVSDPGLVVAVAGASGGVAPAMYPVSCPLLASRITALA
jgi:hypothetical protein